MKDLDKPDLDTKVSAKRASLLRSTFRNTGSITEQDFSKSKRNTPWPFVLALFFVSFLVHFVTTTGGL